MEGPRLEVKSELQLPAYTTATAMPEPLTHWVRPGIESTSLWILARFFTPEPQGELPWRIFTDLERVYFVDQVSPALVWISIWKTACLFPWRFLNTLPLAREGSADVNLWQRILILGSPSDIMLRWNNSRRTVDKNGRFKLPSILHIP